MAAQLEGRTALITGASSGIGRATALALSAAGAAVVVQARRAERLQALAAEIEGRGGKALPAPGDAGSPADVGAVLAQALAWEAGGRKLDAVVVNAGRGLAGGVLGSDTAAWDELYRTNVLGAGHLLRRAGQHMVSRRSGDIVVIGSVVGRNISPYSAFYGSTKFAVAALAEGLRREVCAQGVRVSVVMPGVVVSEFQGVAGYDHENFGKSVARYGKLLEPEAIAAAIAWILSQPPHVNVSELVVRSTGQDYP